MIGVSAGAVQLGLGFDPGQGAEIEPALALVPFLVDVHDEAADWRRLREAVNRHPGDILGVGIPSGGAAVVRPCGQVEPVRRPLVYVKRQEQ